MKIETIPISKIKAAAYNPRKDLKPDDVEYKKLAKSLEEFDLVEPLIWNKRTGNLVGGHQRLKVLKSLGRKEVEVSVVDLDDAKEKALNIALNKISGEWDYPMLKDLLEEINTGAFDIEITGFDDSEIQKLMTQFHVAGEGLTDDDAIPEKVETVCKKGDIWKLGEHRLLCGDATVITDVEMLMAGEKAELLFTSPPYSDMRDYNGGKDLSFENLSEFIPTWVFSAEFQVVNLGIKRKGNEIDQYWNIYLQKAKDCGLKLLSWNVWNRENAGFSMAQITAMFAIQHEFIFVFGKDRKDLNLTVPNKDAGELEDHNWNRQKDGSTKRGKDCIIRSHRQLGTVQTMINEQSREWTKFHPAVFPVTLPSVYIEAMTNTDNIVSDCFGGSGSTLIACEKLGRKCRMMEIDEHYCDVIISRYEAFTGNKAVLLDK